MSSTAATPRHPRPTTPVRLLGAGSLVAAAALLSGCGGPSRENFALQGIAPMNVNEQNESTSVDLRIYELKSDAHFRAATVDQIWTDDKKTLGDDLIGDPTITTVYPGPAGTPPVNVTVDVPQATKFIGVLALYHRADAEDHRMLVAPLDQALHQVITCTGYAVTLVAPGSAAAAPAPAAAAPAPAAAH
jgi:type VI secretion system VasD/TssJ family lipoprotein